MPSFNASLLPTIKPKAKKLSAVQPIKEYQKKSDIFLKDLLPYITSETYINSAVVISTSKIHPSTTLLLLSVQV
jgi:hypothetical protein